MHMCHHEHNRASLNESVCADSNVADCMDRSWKCSVMGHRIVTDVDRESEIECGKMIRERFCEFNKLQLEGSSNDDDLSNSRRVRAVHVTRNLIVHHPIHSSMVVALGLPSGKAFSRRRSRR